MATAMAKLQASHVATQWLRLFIKLHLGAAAAQ
jgi:hypothetical protein